MGYYLSIDLRQESQSIEGNYSRVTASVSITATSGSWATWNGACSGNLVVNGVSHPFSTSYSVNGSTQRLYIDTFTVPHNPDGTKTVSAYASFDAKPSFVGWLSASNGLTLATIPRGSKIASISGSEFGDTYKITWNPATDTFTHRVYWHILTEKEHPWVLVSTGLKDSCEFTVPLELCEKIPKDSSTTLTISLETYSGTTKIWDEIKPYTINVPKTVVPIVDSQDLTEANADLPSAFRGLWVQGISKPKLTTQAHSQYGASIDLIKSTFEEVQYEGSTVVFNGINADGNRKIVTTVTDSRGKVVEITKNIDVIPYNPPKLGGLSFEFCDVDGISDPSGTFIKVKVDGEISPVRNRNTRTLTIKWRKQTTQNFSSKEVPVNNYKFDISTIIGGFDPTLTYELVAELSDAYAKANSSLVTGKVVISRYPGGEGVTFFDEATEPGLNCRGVRYDLDPEELELAKTISNTKRGKVRLGKLLGALGLRVPIEITTSGQFEVVKYSDGTCEVSCQITQITPVNMVQWNSCWWRWIGNLRLPYGLFKRVDNVQVSGHCNGGVYTCGSGKKTDVLQIVLLMPTPAWTANQVPTELPFVRVYGRYKD